MSNLGPCLNSEIFIKFINIHIAASTENEVLASQLINELSDKEIELLTQFNEGLKAMPNLTIQDLFNLEYKKYEEEIKKLNQTIAAGKAERAEILNQYQINTRGVWPTKTVTPTLDLAAQIKENARIIAEQDRFIAEQTKEVEAQEKKLKQMEKDIYKKDRKKCSIQ